MRIRNSTVAACITACIIAVGDFRPEPKFEEVTVIAPLCAPEGTAKCAGLDWAKVGNHLQQ